jgi:hypothetical protein
MQWSCNDEHSVRQGTSWNTVGILWQDSRKAANFDIKSCNFLRHARFSQKVCWDVTKCHCWACSSDVSAGGLLDRTALSDHEDGGNTMDRTVGTTVIPRLTKIIRSGITFVSRNVISSRFL